MTKSILLLTLVFAFLGAASTPSSGGLSTANIDRGRYLVENVAMCGQCHTPRDGDGELLQSQWLKGAAVPTQNPFGKKVWAEFAPRIAGLPQYSDPQALKLFTDGTARTGKLLRGPMPPYRMSEKDAQDLIAYLRSLE